MPSRRVAWEAVCTGAVCVLLLALVYGAAIRTATGQRFEDAVLTAANQHQRALAIDVLDAITVWSLAAMVILVVGIGWFRGRLPLGLAGGGVILSSVVMTEFARWLVSRPVLLEHGYRRLDQSFPSGHTAIAMSVMCALVMVAPYRSRGAVALLTALWAVGIGALTVTASWHRPSDTVGSDLIVLGNVCAAITLLSWYGAIRTAEPLTGHRRTSRGLLVGGLGAAVLAALAVTAVLGGSALNDLAADPDPDFVPGSALPAGRSITVTGGLLLLLALLALLRRIELRRPELPRVPGERPQPVTTSGDEAR